jgi:dephospho-CoA kinase
MEQVWGNDKSVVGLTGGIACGKSTALGFFEARGWATYSTDAIVAHLLAEDQELAESVRKEFGPDFLLPEGGVDKGKLATIVFSDSSKRRWLEQLVHPLVREEWVSQVSRSAGTRHLVEIPLLFENNLESLFSCVISIYCSQNLQRKRLIDKGMTIEDANARIDAQMPVQEKIEKSDVTLHNDGDLSHLEAQINAFLEKFPLT